MNADVSIDCRTWGRKKRQECPADAASVVYGSSSTFHRLFPRLTKNATGELGFLTGILDCHPTINDVLDTHSVVVTFCELKSPESPGSHATPRHPAKLLFPLSAKPSAS